VGGGSGKGVKLEEGGGLLKKEKRRNERKGKRAPWEKVREVEDVGGADGINIMEGDTERVENREGEREREGGGKWQGKG